MIKRLKNLWKLGEEKTVKQVYERLDIEREESEIGDGKAEFLSEMTEQEYDDYIHEEQNGWKNLKRKIGL